MDRRKFLSGAVAAAALPAVAPLVPAAAVHMPPAASITGVGIMCRLSAEQIAAETLRILSVRNPFYDLDADA